MPSLNTSENTSRRANGRTVKLVQYSESEHDLADITQDLRGRSVIDSDGTEIGEVRELFIDLEKRRPRFLLVVSTGFLGFGETSSLLPVETILEVTADSIYISKSKNQVRASPPYNPRLSDEPEWEDLYRYYGYLPYWVGGKSQDMHSYL